MMLRSHSVFFIGVLLLLIVCSSGVYGQAPGNFVDCHVLNSVVSNYTKVIFQDDFRGDVEGKFPSHWKFFFAQNGASSNERWVSVKKYRGQKILRVEWGLIKGFYPLNGKARLALPDSFTVEFDYLLERYSVARDTTKVVSEYVVKDAIQPKHDDWPHTSSSKDWRTPVVEPKRVLTGDSAEFEVVRTYSKMTVVPDYDKSVWHHCIILVRGKRVAGYVGGDRPFVAFRDTSFSFNHLSLVLLDSLYYKNIKISAYQPSAGGSGGSVADLNTTGRFTTHAILFDIGKADIKPGNDGILRELLDWLRAHPTAKLEIDGHTDSQPGVDNMVLSLRRADAIKKWLAMAGIGAERLTTKGFGATKPLDTNSTPEGMARNRRVEFVVL